ncbi:unnamed protein product [Ceratitis capitata]|uniref:(Mediterranean fruit fly) hypothetical protein n=1 Tax=Ceratitis capitata TaxID=7213 RepID=A0A811VGH5_CERCA|nr:unnamed protein product [Ceratitis capitata]
MSIKVIPLSVMLFRRGCLLKRTPQQNKRILNITNFGLGEFHSLIKPSLIDEEMIMEKKLLDKLKAEIQCIRMGLSLLNHGDLRT